MPTFNPFWAYEPRTPGDPYGFRPKRAPAVAPVQAHAGTMDAGNQQTTGSTNVPNPAPPPSQAAQTTSQPTGGEDRPQVDRNVAGSALGYDTANPSGLAGIGSIAGLMMGIPGGGWLGGKLDDAMGPKEGPQYGDYGTMSSAGGLFGYDGKVYDPITGKGTGEYATMGDAWNSKVDSYNNLSQHMNPAAAALGDYGNTDYYWEDQGLDAGYQDLTGISAATQQGLDTTASKIYENTAGYSLGDSMDDLEGNNQFQPNEITAEMLGADAINTHASDLADNTGVWGEGSGDLFMTDEGNLGVLNDSGQLTTAGGTVIQSNQTDNKVVQAGGDASFSNPYIGHGGVEQPEHISQVEENTWDDKPDRPISTPQDVGAVSSDIFASALPQPEKEEKPASTFTSNLTAAAPKPEKEESGGGGGK